MPLPPNTRLNRYEIRSLLGAGGMGEVYLAEDTELERAVALKVLLAEVAADEDRVRRFVQEAKSASALNHPNILTVYEIGSFENSRFIATELIKGETLRERLQGEPLTLRETLDVAVQIASALNAAHAARIVHRDVKPENVMRRDDGLVKVLDFGLAKLTEQKAGSLDSEGETRALEVKTLPGMVMGTVAYMSPEQARGKEVDARTDVWSLGVVVYEMLTRGTPFAGETTNDTIAAILTREPAPLNENTPTELQRIIRKALQKDRGERYQTVKDLLLDLKNLRRELDFAEEIERSQIPPFARAANVGTSQSVENATAVLPAASSTQNSLPQPTSSAEYIAGEFKKHKRGVALGAIILLALIGVGSWSIFDRAAGNKQIESIAVMPFVNESGNADTEYLSDGISEALINSLTELQQLKVIARSTAFRFKGKDIDPQQIGRELNVRAVLTGRVRQIGDKLNVQVDLADASTGAQLWGEEYERKIADIVSIKQAIAREVTDKLRLRLSGNEQQQLARHDTTNAEAYQFYLRGRYYWNKRTAEGFKKAIEQFQQAVDNDPSFALADVGLADCYAVMEQYAGVPSSESLPKARAAVLRALQIDDSLAEAHASLGLINEHSGHFADAEKEYKRAIELNPNYPTVHHWYALLLLLTGRLDDGMAEIKRAQQLDPLSAVITANVGNHYFGRGDLNAAVEEYKKAIELNPNFGLAHSFLGLTYLKQGREQEARVELQKAVEATGRASQELGALGYGYGVMGKRAEAMAVLRELEEKYTRRESPGLYIAEVYAGLGEKDQAFVWLEKDFQARSSLLMYMDVFPLEPLRDDPRYTDLLQRVGQRP
jgi:serine/threonine protein kinase/Flp pilus assembly protein TadD